MVYYYRRGGIGGFSLYTVYVVHKDSPFEHMVKVKDIKDDL